MGWRLIEGSGIFLGFIGWLFGALCWRVFLMRYSTLWMTSSDFRIGGWKTDVPGSVRSGWSLEGFWFG